MKKAIISVLGLGLALLLFLGFLYYKSIPLSITQAEQTAEVYQHPTYRYAEQYGEEEEKGINETMVHLMQMRINQVTGKVAEADVRKAYHQVNQQRDNIGTSKQRRLRLQWEEMGPNNFGGRCRALLFDKDNPDHLLAGSVSGGLFFSNDGGLNWEPHEINQFLSNASITAIAQASNGDIYFGGGEFFAPELRGIPTIFGAPGFIGEGMYKSTDNGLTFSKLDSTAPIPNVNDDTWSYVSEIQIDPVNPNKLYVSTRRGLQISDDGGMSWFEPVFTNVTVNVQNLASREVEVGPDGTVYVEIGDRYFRSLDGLNFEEFTDRNGFPSQFFISRIEFATTPQAPNTVFAAIVNNRSLSQIIKSEDSGENWTQVAEGSISFNPQGQQGTWNLAFGVDPSSTDKMVIGGQLELWTWSETGNKDLIAYWQPDSPTNPYYVHADMHGVFFHPTDPNVMFVVGDGGIFKTTDAQSKFPTFVMRNKGFNVMQFYGYGASFNGTVGGGSQDNGSNLNDGRNNSPQAHREVSGGDGGDFEFSRINPGAIFVSTISGRMRRSSNFGESFAGFFDETIDPTSSGRPNCNALFLAPFGLWEDVIFDTITRERTRVIEDINSGSQTTTTYMDTMVVKNEKSIFFLTCGGRVWFTPEALEFSDTPEWFDIRINGTASELATTVDGKLYIGTTGGNVYRVTGIDRYRLDSNFVAVTRVANPANANEIFIDTLYNYFFVHDYPDNWAHTNANNYRGMTRLLIADNADWSGPVNSTGGRYVTGIAVDEMDSNRVVVTLGNYGNTDYVYETNQATSSGNIQWSSLQNNLPQMPVFDGMIDFANSNNIILGTEFGVWASDDGGQSWFTQNAAPLNAVPVFKIRQDALYEDDCRVIYIGTHGRGGFKTSTLTNFECDLEPYHPVDYFGKIDIATGIADNVSTDAQFNIYPNPVEGSATVEFDLVEASSSDWIISVFDLSGRVVREQRQGKLSIGTHKLPLDLSGLTRANYIVTLRSGDFVASKKVLVLN